MQTWRRQTIIVGLCFAVVVAARFYVKNLFQGLTDGSPAVSTSAAEGAADGPASGSSATPDTVVTLDLNP